jgi:phosphatidylglycerol lysyltransferase
MVEKEESPKNEIKKFDVWKLLNILSPILSIFIITIAGIFIYKIFQQHSLDTIMEHLRSIPTIKFYEALGVTFITYLILSVYDFLAVRYLALDISKWKVGLISFVAFAFGNAIGMANLASSSVRLRMYPFAGIHHKDVLKIIIFCSLSYWLGFFSLAGSVMAFEPLDLLEKYNLSPALIRGTGLGFLAVCLTYLFFCFRHHKPLTIKGQQIVFPRFSFSLTQILVAALDWGLLGFALYILLPDGIEVTFFYFLQIFLTAQVVAVLAHVPGGIGVLEAMIIYFLDPQGKFSGELLACFIAYRSVMYLLPLTLASSFFVIFEIYNKKAKIKPVS